MISGRLNKTTDLKLLNYIQYGWYLGIHWGWLFALRLIREEMAGEKKYGIRTTGADELKSLQQSGVDISHATIYMPVSYRLLEKALENLPPGRQHFVDIGCGKGRALCVAGRYGFSKVTGIDFSPGFCAEAARNLQHIKQPNPAFRYEILLEDAGSWPIPDDTDCLFMFNPFDAEIMKKVITQIGDSLRRHPRKLQIIYVNPLCRDLFTSNGFTEYYHYRKGRHLELSLLCN